MSESKFVKITYHGQVTLLVPRDHEPPANFDIESTTKEALEDIEGLEVLDIQFEQEL